MHEFCCASKMSLHRRLCKLLTMRDLYCTFSISLVQLKMLFANFMGVVLLTAVYCQQSLPLFEHEGLGLSNNSFIYYPDIGDGRYALKCVTGTVNCCNNQVLLVAGEMREGEQSTREQMGQLVCMSLEEME